MSIRQSYCAALVFGACAALFYSSCKEDTCAAGADGCPCDMEGSCALGLMCIQGWCQADNVGASATVTSQPGTSTGSDDTSSGASTSGSRTDATTGETSSTGGVTTTGMTSGEITSGEMTSGEMTSTGAMTTTGGLSPKSPVFIDHVLIEVGEARDIEVTPAGELAVVGFVERANNDRDAWIGVFSEIDQLVWERTFDGEEGDDDAFNGVAVDSSGKITATGKNDRLAHWDDVVTITWDAQGNQLDLRGYGHEAMYDDVGYDVAVDAEGNVYVCGTFTYAMYDDKAAYTQRYADASGTSWRKNTGLGEDRQNDCEVGPTGYLITAGVNGSAGSVHRIAADGDTIYRHNYSHPETNGTTPLGLAIDPDDDSIYVVGYAKGAPSQKPWIAKWDWAGDEVWGSDVTMEGEIAHARDVLIDPQGWIRVVGADRVDEVWSIVITTFDPEGAERDRAVWSLPGTEVRALGAAVRDDVLYVVGGTESDEDGSEVLLAAFEI